jgi:Uma2 family endonuclease
MEQGSLAEGLHYELFDGDILEPVSQKPPHPALVMRWLLALINLFGGPFIQCQMPIVLADDTELEPDVSVLVHPTDDYLNTDNPPASDVRLVIEVASTTLLFDAGAKARRYAAAGIPECWVSDITGRRLLLHRDPTSEGYATVLILGPDDSVSPLAAPQASFRVGDFLP